MVTKSPLDSPTGLRQAGRRRHQHQSNLTALGWYVFVCGNTCSRKCSRSERWTAEIPLWRQEPMTRVRSRRLSYFAWASVSFYGVNEGKYRLLSQPLSQDFSAGNMKPTYIKSTPIEIKFFKNFKFSTWFTFNSKSNSRINHHIIQGKPTHYIKTDKWLLPIRKSIATSNQLFITTKSPSVLWNHFLENIWVPKKTLQYCPTSSLNVDMHQFFFLFVIVANTYINLPVSVHGSEHFWRMYSFSRPDNLLRYKCHHPYLQIKNLWCSLLTCLWLPG